MAVAAFLVGASLLPIGTASSSEPTQWPEEPGTNPDLVATANTIRFAGADRYQTNLALGLALRGMGDFPFDTSDRTSGNAARLSQAKQWWGAGSCPRSIIVVAGDTVADSLTAASLSDPTDRGDQPRAQRVAASDPLFDPPGGFGRVDTAYAPIVVTTSARTGASSLAPTARLTAADLASGGCALARQAILVGGTSAVPVGVESELVSLGYDEVFRIAGVDRYDTAARVATALGTGTPSATRTTCDDPSASDGTAGAGYYGNAVVEYRADADACRLLTRTIVLTDGTAGIDALAAGWWTSYWQVPVLLTGPGGALPPATRVALQSLDIDTIIVLGGTARIPEETTVRQAKQLAGAVAGRFAGNDRYGTSVLMAQVFGGWYAGPGATFAGDLVCLAASSGTSGSPDALSAGPFCGRLGAGKGGGPVRAQPPVEGPAARSLSVGGLPGGHSMVPVLLVPQGGPLPAPVSELLDDAFAAARCSGSAAPTGCAEPGFATIIGGGVGPSAVAQLGDLLGAPGTAGHSPVAEGFATRLDMRPVFAAPAAPAGTVQACYGSDALDAVRWLSLSPDATQRTFLGQRDVLRDGWYVDGASAPNCMVLPNLAKLTITGVGVAGQLARPAGFDLAPPSALTVSRPFVQEGSEGRATGAISWLFDQPPTATVNLVRNGISREVQTAGLTLNLTSRVDAPGTGVAAGRLTVATAFGQLTGTIRADARQVGGLWELAGTLVIGPFADGTLRGGFRATISGSGTDRPTVSWAIDGVPTS